MGNSSFAKYVHAVAAELGWTAGEVTIHNCTIKGPDVQRVSIYDGDQNHRKTMTGRVAISLHSTVDEFIPNHLRPRQFTLAADRGPGVAVREIRKLLPNYQHVVEMAQQAQAAQTAARANRLTLTKVVAEAFAGRITSNDPDYPEVHFDSGTVKLRGSDVTFTVKVPARHAAHLADVLALAIAHSPEED